MKIFKRYIVFFVGLALPIMMGSLSGDAAQITPERVLEAIETAPVPAASNWTFEGCAKLRPWTACQDIYRDPSGALWVCSSCGKTKNPSSGKCSPLTSSPAEWCS